MTAAREALNSGDYSAAIAAYHGQLKRRDQPGTRVEYALALAGQGLRDLALTQLDEAAADKPLTGENRYVAAACFRALGYASISKGMDASNEDRPAWLTKDVPARQASGGAVMEFRERALNANRLAAQGQPHLAAAEFADLAAEEPKDFLVWVGQSIALEKMQAYGAAKEALGKAQAAAPKNEAAKKLVAARQRQVKEAEDRPARAKEPLTPTQARYMVFGGGQFGGQGSGSLNGRFGYFLTPRIDAGVDIGLLNMGGSSSSASGSSNFSLGVSTRYYWPIKKAGNVALGARVGFAGNQASLTVSPGFTSPFGDAFVDITLAQSGASVGFTIGATTFLGGKK